MTINLLNRYNAISLYSGCQEDRYRLWVIIFTAYTLRHSNPIKLEFLKSSVFLIYQPVEEKAVEVIGQLGIDLNPVEYISAGKGASTYHIEVKQYRFL